MINCTTAASVPLLRTVVRRASALPKVGYHATPFLFKLRGVDYLRAICRDVDKRAKYASSESISNGLSLRRRVQAAQSVHSSIVIGTTPTCSLSRRHSSELIVEKV